MQRLLIDMDGVLADVYAQFIAYETAEHGHTKSLEEMHGLWEHEVFPNLTVYINSPGFFFNALPIEGSIEALKVLNEHYELYIVSSATEFPLSLTEKMLWLNKHFPFLTWKQVVLCGTKEIVSGDIMIDDHFKNLDPFKGRTLLFTQPHNINRHDHHHNRVNNWKEISEILLAK